jgi:DNA-binding MarR family transcriptional regulator
MEASVIPLLELWEKFKVQKAKGNLEDFARWILTSKTVEKRPPSTFKKTEAGNIERLAMLISRLQKFLGLAVRPTLQELGFTKDNEYHFLYQIWKVGSTNKNDLSKDNAVEFSTGRDIIKRLIRRKLISEKQDPADKRASLLSLTPKGKKVLEMSFEKLVIPFSSYLGDLKNEEQAQLITLLERLNHYHERMNKQNNS